MTNIDYARCPKCGEIKDGLHLGTMLVSQTISISHRSKANTPIATIHRCGRCSYIQNIYLIKGGEDYDGKKLVGEAQKNGITIDMIRACYKQMPCDYYALSELKSGVVRGAPKREITTDYNPDEQIEQRATMPQVEEKLF